MSAAVDRLSELAGKALRGYVDSGGGDTNLLREAAGHMVTLRQLHQTASGSSDLLGRSAAYRRVATSVYSASGVAEGKRAGLTTKMSYHIGVVLRERLTPDELEAAGVPVTSFHRRLWQERQARMKAADPVEQALEIARLVDELYHPEGRVVWWRKFSEQDDDGRRRMIRNVIGLVDGVFL